MGTMTTTSMGWGVEELPDIVCPVPAAPLTHDEARAMFKKVKKEMPGLQESAYRREAARRLNMDYDTYLAAWKKPGSSVIAKPKVKPPATMQISDIPKQPTPAVAPTFVPPQGIPQPYEGWLDTSALPRTTRHYPNPEDDIEKGLNLLHDMRATNPKYGRLPKYDVNCVHVVQAQELRRRGFDVEATPLPKQYGRGGRVVSESLVPAWRERTTGYSRNETYAANEVSFRAHLATLPPGARGAVAVTWKGKNSGHIWNWEVVEEEGKAVVKWIEAQKGHLLQDDAASYFQRGERIRYIRMDDLEPTNAAKEFIQVRDEEYLAKEEKRLAREAAKREAERIRRLEFQARWEEYVRRKAALAKTLAENPV